MRTLQRKQNIIPQSKTHGNVTYCNRNQQLLPNRAQCGAYNSKVSCLGSDYNERI